MRSRRHIRLLLGIGGNQQSDCCMADVSDLPVPLCVSLLKSVQLRMLFCGTTAKPTKSSIDLVSIKDDDLHPDGSNEVAYAIHNKLNHDTP